MFDIFGGTSSLSTGIVLLEHGNIHISLDSHKRLYSSHDTFKTNMYIMMTIRSFTETDEREVIQNVHLFYKRIPELVDKREKVYLEKLRIYMKKRKLILGDIEVLYRKGDKNDRHLIAKLRSKLLSLFLELNM